MKIQFCDLCNESVPQGDLEEGRAHRRGDRLVCANCERAMSPQAEDGAPVPVGEETTIMETRLAPSLPARRSGGPGALAAVTLASLSLVFTVGALTFLFEEIEGRSRALQGDLSAERAKRVALEGRLEREVGGTLRETADGLAGARRTLTELRSRVDAMSAGQGEGLVLLRADIQDLRAELSDLGRLSREIEEQRAELTRMADASADVYDRFLRVERRVRDLEELGATALLAPGPGIGGAGSAQASEPSWTSLLPELASKSPSDRWKAVQALGETADPAVAEHLVALLKDEDIFVRMATARILGDLEAPVGIEPLIDALEDSEASVREAAVVSLRSITGRSFQFNPGAKESDRAKRIKAWRDWWKRSADDYLNRT